METKNIYQKLQQARVDLQNLKLKKSGENKYSNYKYYELGDFLPALNELMVKHGLMSLFSINTTLLGDASKEYAKLVIVNADKADEEVSFVIPTAEVEIGKKKDGSGGAEPIQNLGGKTTYLRRYLHMIAFEMVESDIVEQVKRDLTDEVSDSDLELIKTSPDVQSLQKLCADLKMKYNVKLIMPHYERRKVELEQREQS